VRFLVDANILSEPTKAQPASRVVEWLRRNESELVVDPVILGEIRFGILALPRSRRRDRLEQWFQKGVLQMEFLPWDFDVSMNWAALLARLRSSGKAMPIKDSLIAATALTHDLTVATRNEADFAKARVRVVNPFE
jgi:predicted nucleic acid-binding protein